MKERLEDHSIAQQSNTKKSTTGAECSVKELIQRFETNYDSGYEADETIKRLSIKYGLSNSDHKGIGQSNYNPSSQINSVNVEGITEGYRCK